MSKPVDLKDPKANEMERVIKTKPKDETNVMDLSFKRADYRY